MISMESKDSRVRGLQVSGDLRISSLLLGMYLRIFSGSEQLGREEGDPVLGLT